MEKKFVKNKVEAISKDKAQKVVSRMKMYIKTSIWIMIGGGMLKILMIPIFFLLHHENKNFDWINAFGGVLFTGIGIWIWVWYEKEGRAKINQLQEKLLEEEGEEEKEENEKDV